MVVQFQNKRPNEAGRYVILSMSFFCIFNEGNNWNKCIIRTAFRFAETLPLKVPSNIVRSPSQQKVPKHNFRFERAGICLCFVGKRQGHAPLFGITNKLTL